MVHDDCLSFPPTILEFQQRNENRSEVTGERGQQLIDSERSGSEIEAMEHTERAMA
jgi:hypothetical protein